MDREFATSVAFITFVFLVVIAVIVLKQPEITETTPMDVIIRMRNSDGEIDQTWSCHFEDEKGWICDPTGE